jgi:predicted nucleic acid-binding protein
VILVDSNGLLDVLTRDPKWYSWSLKALSDAASTNRLVINPIIFSEVSFLAVKAFLRYRQKGGNKTSPLPDFFIGAHASHENYKLLSRDRHRFQNYFPKLQIIRPNT